MGLPNPPPLPGVIKLVPANPSPSNTPSPEPHLRLLAEHPEDSAHITLTAAQRWRLLAGLAVAVAALLWRPHRHPHRPQHARHLLLPGPHRLQVLPCLPLALPSRPALAHARGPRGPARRGPPRLHHSRPPSTARPPSSPPSPPAWPPWTTPSLSWRPSSWSRRTTPRPGGPSLVSPSRPASVLSWSRPASRAPSPAPATSAWRWPPVSCWSSTTPRTALSPTSSASPPGSSPTARTT